MSLQNSAEANPPKYPEKKPAKQTGMFFAYEMDSGGNVRPVPSLNASVEEGKWLLAHLLRDHPKAVRWIERESGIPMEMAQAFLAEETRPRLIQGKDCFYLNIRGLNFDPEAEDEMISLRMYATEKRVISVRKWQMLAAQDVQKKVEEGQGPRTPCALVAALVERTVDRLTDHVVELETQLDSLEEKMSSKLDPALKGELAALRKRAIIIRRYISPQRDVIHLLSASTLPWITEVSRISIRESADRLSRMVEDLDALWQMANVTQEEMNARMGEQINRTMYLMSLLAGVFLPLTFITGLLGMNVAGIPGAEGRHAFLWVCLGLVCLGLMQWGWFRLRRWV